MARKKWSRQTEITPSLLIIREKRKWQIALRRYVLKKDPCRSYAPYFGLDIENMREWFEVQFEKGMGWDDFGKKWQFDHIIPVTHFDFSIETELKMCWNFINLRVEKSHEDKNRGNKVNILMAKGYFKELYDKTQYFPCLKLLEKIDQIESTELTSTESQQSFITSNRTYLEMIETYSEFEFELLNSGRPIEEVRKEIEFLRKFEQ